MQERDDRSTMQTHEAGPSAPLLKEPLAAHLFNAESGADFGLEFEDEGESPATAAPTPPAEKPAEQHSGSTSGDASDATAIQRSGADLSDEELAWVLGRPTVASSWNEPVPSVRSKPRAAPRYAVSTRASVRVASAADFSRTAVGAGETETVRLRNLSVGGVSAFHAHPLRPGDTFWITLRSPDDRAASLARNIDRRCTVLRCEPGGTGNMMFSIAAQFIA